ncbi:MAG: AraC family transcriptional regulator [Clostridia bacterium]|nr:AraC family transcriptional regulator [Clostridia bacterium]
MTTDTLKENKMHGTAILPVAIYIETIGTKLREFPLHWHHEMEFVYIADGRGTFTINLQKYTVEKGDYLVVPPDALHAFMPLSNCSCTCHTLILDLRFVESTMLDAITTDYIHPIIKGKVAYHEHFSSNLKGYDAIKDCHARIIALKKEKPSHYALKLKACVFELLVHLFDSKVITNQSDSPITNHDIEALRKVLKYLYDHRQDAISIRDLAAIANYSNDYFIRFFKKHLHQTPLAYIKSYRLDYSRTLLETREISITEVSHESGFNDVSYFIKSFKEQYGMTPKDYRHACLVLLPSDIFNKLKLDTIDRKNI